MQRIDFDTIDSTNTFLKNNYDHLPDMTFVSAMLQTAGRGRNNRRWLSDRGNSLMFSVLLLNRYYMETLQVPVYIGGILSHKGS